MGNSNNKEPSLKQAIQQERWGEVDEILQTESGRERARNKIYRIYPNDWYPTNSSIVGYQEVKALHLACLANAPGNIVRMLLDIGSPGAAGHLVYPSGETPLHCVVRSTFRKMKRPPGVGQAAIGVLLQERPQSVSQRSSPEFGSRTPLHLACDGRAPTTMIAMLFNADPEAARTVQDAHGRTAIQVAKRHSFLYHPKWRWRVGCIFQRLNENDDAADEWVDPIIDIGPPSEEPNEEDRTCEPARDECNEDDDLCVLCWNDQADHVLVPCGHMCLCRKCSMSGILRGAALRGTCPVCKCRVDQAIRVFRSGVPNPA